MVALAFLVLLLVLLAAARTSGWRIPAISASIAAGAWAISCLLAPTAAAASEGHAWAWAALVWAVVTLASCSGAVTRRVWHRSAGPDAKNRRDDETEGCEPDPCSDPAGAVSTHSAGSSTPRY